MGIHYPELFSLFYITPGMFAVWEWCWLFLHHPSPLTGQAQGRMEEKQCQRWVMSVPCMSQCPAECGSGTQGFPSAALHPEPERSSSEKHGESPAVNVREKSLQRSCCPASC